MGVMDDIFRDADERSSRESYSKGREDARNSNDLGSFMEDVVDSIVPTTDKARHAGYHDAIRNGELGANNRSSSSRSSSSSNYGGGYDSGSYTSPSRSSSTSSSINPLLALFAAGVLGLIAWGVGSAIEQKQKLSFDTSLSLEPEISSRGHKKRDFDVHVIKGVFEENVAGISLHGKLLYFSKPMINIDLVQSDSSQKTYTVNHSYTFATQPRVQLVYGENFCELVDYYDANVNNRVNFERGERVFSSNYGDIDQNLLTKFQSRRSIFNPDVETKAWPLSEELHRLLGMKAKDQ